MEPREQIMEEAKQVQNQPSQQGVEMTEDARNIAMILSLSSQNESLKNDPEIKNLFDMIEKDGQKPAPKKAAAKTEETETTEEEDDSVFFSKHESDSNQYDLNTLEGLKEYAKATYGTDKFDRVLKDAKTWKEGAAKTTEIEKNLGEVNNFLAGLPDPIYDAIEAYYYGRDWKSTIGEATSKVSFDKSFDAQSKFDIVEHYFPKQFNQEDADENTELYQKAVNMSKRSFELDQERRSQEKESLNRNLESQAKVIQASVDKSLSTLRKTFPAMGDSALNKVAKMLQTGDYKKLFINDDGTFSPDAAKNIALALYGDKEIRRTERGKASQEANDTVEKILSRASTKVKDTGSGSTAQTGNGGNNEFMKFLSGYMPETTTYSAKQNKQ